MSAVLAVNVGNLYHVVISVASQTNDLKEQAVKDGFLDVLIKITGNPAIDKNPVIKAALKKADYYVQEYSYSSVSTDSSQYQLQISYDPDDINRLIKKANMVSWGESRPLILVWLVVTDRQHNVSVVNEDTQGTVFDMIKQESKRYGLPLIFPVMDMDDMKRVSSDDVSEMNIPVLQEAGQRYSPDALLIGGIEENDQGSQSHWQLVMKDQQWDWKIENKTTSDVISSVINQVYQYLSRRDEPKSDMANTLVN